MFYKGIGDEEIIIELLFLSMLYFSDPINTLEDHLGISLYMINNPIFIELLFSILCMYKSLRSIGYSKSLLEDLKWILHVFISRYISYKILSSTNIIFTLVFKPIINSFLQFEPMTSRSNYIFVERLEHFHENKEYYTGYSLLNTLITTFLPDRYDMILASLLYRHIKIKRRNVRCLSRNDFMLMVPI